MGTQFMLPLLTAMVGAIFGTRLNPDHGLIWGAGIGFGIGLAVVAGVSLLIALLRRF